MHDAFVHTRRMVEVITMQVMYVKHNTDVHLCNHCCSGKAICIIQSEHVFIALDIQHAMYMLHIVIFGLSGSTRYFHFIS